jgi:putative phage-type endonuclease
MEQRTIDWHAWRKLGVGASETPTLMGEADWFTPYGLWEEKTGRKAKDQSPNFAMQRGTNAEPKIRALYELYNDIAMPAALAIHPELSFFRASLDGFNEGAKGLAEFKYPSKAKHEQAVAGQVPTCYVGQLQHQLFVTDAEWVDYVSYNGSDIAVVRVTPDLEYRKKMINVVSEFWKCVETDTPPDLTDADYVSLDTLHDILLFEQWKAADQALKDAEAKRDEITKRIKSEYVHARVMCSGVSLVRSTRKGAVDYAKIPQLKGVDLEPFRKKASEVVTIKIAKARV